MPEPTYYAKILIEKLKRRGIKAELEYDDGHKSVDIFIPDANIEIEVDGNHHYNDSTQAFRDLLRTKYSMLNGKETIRIPNTLAYNYLSQTADLIEEIVQDRIGKRKGKNLRTKQMTLEQTLPKKIIKRYKIKFRTHNKDKNDNRIENLEVIPKNKKIIRLTNNTNKSKKIIIVVSIILVTLLILFSFIKLSQSYSRLNRNEIAFIISLYEKYPQAPTIEELKLKNKINEHVNSICKTHCDNQFFNQAHLGMSGNNLEIQCYCSDSNSSQVNLNFYLIDSKTGDVLLHNIQK